jgi:biopolymer transport protein ExbB/TolQ
METFVQGWSLTIALCGAIVLVFAYAWLQIARERAWVAALSAHLLAKHVGEPDKPATGESRHKQEVRQAVHAIETASGIDALTRVRDLEKRVQRLEPTLAFWVDLLRQLGLLGTVIGIGLSLAYTGGDLTKLLGPLALKVWTTVAGLGCSILLSTMFARDLTWWVDDADKHLEAWVAKRGEA